MRFFLILIMLFLGCCGSLQAQGTDGVADVLAQITQQMSDLRSVQVDFIQEKNMMVFSTPIELRGTLSWERPDSFAWNVVSPIQYVMVMREGMARQWDGESGAIQEFRMSANPIMRVASQQLQRWFSGNYQQLTTEYDVSLVSSQPLILKCVPHSGSQEAGIVEHVSIQFRNDLRYIDAITIQEASGDSTAIKFENVRLNEVIPADSWKVAR